MTDVISRLKVNHGAFGGVLRPGFDTAVAWQEYAEMQPLRFFDRVLLPYVLQRNAAQCYRPWL